MAIITKKYGNPPGAIDSLLNKNRTEMSSGQAAQAETPKSISGWLDQKEAAGFDVSQMTLPEDLARDEDPDETVFFKAFNPCSILCTGNHPFSTVERFGHWYHARGQDKKAGIHKSGMEWSFFTKDKDLAIKTAKSHIE